MSTDSDFPAASAVAIPAVTASQMREIDRLASERFDLRLIQMMENAGARLADLAIRRFRPRAATVLSGPGGNGGGGLVAARHLSDRGVQVTVVLDGDRERLGEITRHQLSIVQRMGVPTGRDPVPAELVIDALIGYALRGDPRGPAADLIRWANVQPAPVCALDLPSGLDATTGRVGRPCVRATVTLTLARPKTGLARARPVVGDLYLADISIPPAAYAEVGIEPAPIFAEGPILRLR